MATQDELNDALSKLRQRIGELEQVVADGKRAQLEINKLNQELLSNMKELRDLDDPFAKGSGAFPTSDAAPDAAEATGSERAAGAPGCEQDLDSTRPIDLEKLQEMSKGADLLVLSRVYFSTADRAIKEANQALINKDYRALKAVARELENQSLSFSTPEMLKLSKELESAASTQDGTAGKIFVEALKLALETVKSFVYAHHDA